MENLYGRIAPIAVLWWRTLWAAVDSWLGHRVEIVLVAIIALAVSFWFADRQRTKLRNITYKFSMPGPIPSLLESINRQLAEIQTQKSALSRGLRRASASVFIFGFLIPSIILGAGILFYGWFIPGHEALIQRLNCNGYLLSGIGFVTTASFVLSQFFMGFGQHVDEISSRLPIFASAASLDPANGYIAGAVILYRLFIGAFAALFLQLVYRAWSVGRQIGKREKILLERKNVARQAEISAV